MQSYDYARSIVPMLGQKPRWAQIEIDDCIAGLVQISEVSALWGLVHGVMLDRGPLWCAGYGSHAHFEAFIKVYSTLFPRRLGRKRRILPEVAQGSEIDNIMTRYGWRKKDNAGHYQTLWLDLTQSEGGLRKNMRKSWRQSLIKSEKASLEMTWDDTGKSLPLFTKRYALEKASKAYTGTSPQMLACLSKACFRDGNALIGTAFLDKTPIAAILILKHGVSATYQASWSHPSKARPTCAHHRLLWESALKLKSQGIKDLDLGGFNDETAKSLKTFKAGIGAYDFKSAGLYS